MTNFSDSEAELQSPQKQFGGYLRRERELRRIELDFVVRQLRLSHDRLVDLESGDWDKFGAAVYIRGAISVYAKAIGLDVDDVLLRLDSEVPELERFEDSSFNRESAVFRTDPDPRKTSVWPKFLQIAVLVLVAAIMAWYAFRHEASKIYRQSWEQSDQQSPVLPLTHPVGLTSPVSISDPVAVPITDVVPETKRVVVVAQEESWVEYTADGNPSRDVILQPGRMLTIEATGRVFLRIGNAGGVTVTSDGKVIGPLGPAGVVRQRLLVFE